MESYNGILQNCGLPPCKRNVELLRILANTMLYTQLIGFKDDDFIAGVAQSEEETCQLIETGFEFVYDFNGNKIYKKRK